MYPLVDQAALSPERLHGQLPSAVADRDHGPALDIGRAKVAHGVALDHGQSAWLFSGGG